MREAEEQSASWGPGSLLNACCCLPSCHASTVVCPSARLHCTACPAASTASSVPSILSQHDMRRPRHEVRPGSAAGRLQAVCCGALRQLPGACGQARVSAASSCMLACVALQTAADAGATSSVRQHHMPAHVAMGALTQPALQLCRHLQLRLPFAIKNRRTTRAAAGAWTATGGMQLRASARR